MAVTSSPQVIRHPTYDTPLRRVGWLVHRRPALVVLLSLYVVAELAATSTTARLLGLVAIAVTLVRSACTVIADAPRDRV
jgi:hypothetical protein